MGRSHPEEVRVLEILTSENAARRTVYIEQLSGADTCEISLILMKHHAKKTHLE